MVVAELPNPEAKVRALTAAETVVGLEAQTALGVAVAVVALPITRSVVRAVVVWSLFVTQVRSAGQAELLPLLIELRALATGQPGYISGETLRNVDDPEESLVISTWNSVEDWKTWLASGERDRVQGKIDNLLGVVTEYRVYFYG